MLNLETALAEHFALFKGIGFVVAFSLATALQIWRPYRRNRAEDLANWKINMPLAAVNSILLGSLCASCLCVLSGEAGRAGVGVFHWLSVPASLELLLTVVLLDFVAWGWHRINHTFAALWRFHAVHHSDLNFDTSTALRFHLGELLISTGVRAVMIVLFGLSVSGLLLFEIVFQFFNCFVHGNIRLSSRVEKPFSRLFVTPTLHRRHHAHCVPELHSNFGTIFSFWDRGFGTLHAPPGGEAVPVGLPGQTENLGLATLLRFPFRSRGARGLDAPSHPLGKPPCL
jgi:sterol desaturase/sphingolipid hydroxylase (fatty acid hydroxylase superfamily)